MGKRDRPPGGGKGMTESVPSAACGRLPSTYLFVTWCEQEKGKVGHVQVLNRDRDGVQSRMLS